MNREEVAEKLREKVRSRTAKAAFITVGAAVAALILLAASFVWFGGLATVVYGVLFFAFLAFFPSLIGLLGEATPFNSAIAKLHVVLGAVAFNHHYLVQRDEKWEWCPGDADRVYIDEEWHEINGGQTNRSVLGWRPFGVLRYKDGGTLETERVGPRDGATADGGKVERGGYAETAPPAETDGWVLDLKRVWSRGLQKIGDIELIETAEEIIERGQVNDSRIEGWKPVIGSIVGLLLGVLTGYFYLVSA